MKRHLEGLLWALSVCALFAASSGSSRSLLIVLGFLWLASTAIVIPVHFYRAWKKLARVPNRSEYAVWVGFETVAAVILVSLGIYGAISR